MDTRRLTEINDDGQRRILLTDFGIARSAADASGLTATNMTVGMVAPQGKSVIAG